VFITSRVARGRLISQKGDANTTRPALDAIYYTRHIHRDSFCQSCEGTLFRQASEYFIDRAI